MTVIKSGISEAHWTIDPTSKAARIMPYDMMGECSAPKRTFRASTNPTITTAANNALPFFVMYGGPPRKVELTRLRISGTSTATLAIQGVTLNRYAGLPTGGTITTLTPVALDSMSEGTSVAICQCYTAVPTTAGNIAGQVAGMRLLNKSNTALDGAAPFEALFEFDGRDSGGAVLNHVLQGIGLVLHVATATTLAITVEWIESDAH